MFSPPMETPRRTMRFCAVCGDSPAKVHYGVLACFGCKGFFRRAVKDGRNKYVCRYERRCNVDKYERNSCRYCRFRRCLQVGMNPDAVRPDRDATGKQRIGRLTKSQKMLLTRKKSLGRTTSNREREEPDDWTKFLNSEYRALLIDLIKLESDVQSTSSTSAPPSDSMEGFSLKSLLADRALHRLHTSQRDSSQSSSPAVLDRSFTALWRVVAVVDWIDGLCRLAEKDGEKASFTVEDKTVLVQSTFCALTVFELVAKTAAASTSSDLLCLYSCTPDHAKGEKLVRTSLEELVNPLRSLQPSEVEFTILKAIVTLNPDAPGLRPMASTRVREMRDCLQELLFKTLKKSRPKTTGVPAANFGNYLLLLPALRHVCDEISSWLAIRHPRVPPPQLSPPQPTERILVDVFNPEIDDLYTSTRRDLVEPRYFDVFYTTNTSCRSDVETMDSSPLPAPPAPPAPQMSVPQITVTEQQSSFMSPLCDFSQLLIDSPVYNNSLGPQCSRPQTLSFSPKLPLQLTRSIEEILRPAGMNVDEAALWRPLASDWADKWMEPCDLRPERGESRKYKKALQANSLNTPVFDATIAQFFPEAKH